MISRGAVAFRLRLAGWEYPMLGLAIAGYALLVATAVILGASAIFIGLPLILLTPYVGVMLIVKLGPVLFMAAVVGAGALLIGVPLLPRLLGLLTSFADLHRRLAGRILGVTIPSPYLPRADGGLIRRIRSAAADPATWRDLAWLFCNAVAGYTLRVLSIALLVQGAAQLLFPLYWPIVDPHFDLNELGLLFGVPVSNGWMALLGVPIGLLTLSIWWLVSPALTRAHGAIAVWLLSPSKLSRRVRELAESRADTIAAQAAELRRIERDLHDGAQARLIALGMNLGMAAEAVDRDPAAARRLLAEAGDTGRQALIELRNLVRGIHPPVLADRGLAGALHALALTSPIPVSVIVSLPGRPAAPVESATYFAVSELLANALKHANAKRIWIRVWHDGERLHLRVGDDGRGGAPAVASDDLGEPTGNGSAGGLRGIARRLSAFDGTMAVVSPPAGPTVVHVELPCILKLPGVPTSPGGLSSPKISPSSATA